MPVTPGPPEGVALRPEHLAAEAQAHFLGDQLSVTDWNNEPIAGAQLWLEVDGEPYTGFTDDTYSTPHARPVVADSLGAFPPLHAPDGVAVEMLLTRPNGARLLRWTAWAGEGYGNVRPG